MDPNPLQYQQADENEPLYRAAMLSTLAVGIIIVLILGISFVVRHSKQASAPVAKHDYDSSPNDTVEGMKQAMSDESSSSYAPTSTVASTGPLPSQSFATTTGQQPGASAGPAVSFPFSAALPSKGSQGGYAQSEGPSKSHTRGTAMRDWASLSPENIADLLSGR